MGENVYTLIARVVNGTPITPAQTLEVVEHLQGIINKRNDTIERIRALQLELGEVAKKQAAYDQADGVAA